MPESRQQRRARERAAQKAGARPGPRPGPGVQPSARVPSHLRTDWDIANPGMTRPAEDTAYDVDVSRSDPDPDDPDDVAGWSAEGGMRGDSAGVSFEWTESLAELVADVVAEVTPWRERYPGLPVVWRLDGNEQDMTDAAAHEGVELLS